MSTHSYPARAVGPRRMQAVAAGVGEHAAAVHAMQEAALKQFRDLQSRQNEDRHKVRRPVRARGLLMVGICWGFGSACRD